MIMGERTLMCHTGLTPSEHCQSMRSPRPSRFLSHVPEVLEVPLFKVHKLGPYNENN